MRAGRVVGIVAGVLGTFVLVLGSIPATRSRVDRLLVLTGVVYAGFSARRLVGAGARPQVERLAPDGTASLADEPDVRMARLDASLAQAAGSWDHFARVTRPALRQLATERLRLRWGIDVTADPAGARRQMGEELWEMFAAEPQHAGPVPGPDRLRVLVERLERL